MHKKALEEDPSVFDYDGHYDEMKEKIAWPRILDMTERKVCFSSLYPLIDFYVAWFERLVNYSETACKLVREKPT